MQLSIRSPEVAKIAGGHGAIESTKATSAARKGPEKIEAYDLVLRAHAAMWLWTHDSPLGARVAKPGDRHRSRERPGTPGDRLARGRRLDQPPRREAGAIRGDCGASK